MADITTVWRTATGDWEMCGPGLKSGDDLQTCLAIMLFTDAAADPDDVIPDGTTDPRGWWGDAFRSRPIGSKLWLYERAKATQATINGVQNAALIAMQPLVEDGVAGQVAAVASFPQPGEILLQTSVYRTGSQVASSYAWAWKLNGGG